MFPANKVIPVFERLIFTPELLARYNEMNNLKKKRETICIVMTVENVDNIKKKFNSQLIF